MGKKCGKFKFFQKVSTKISIISKNRGNLNLSRIISMVLIILIEVSTQPSLDCESLDFKNLEREKKIVDLDCRENLDTWKKLVSTHRTFSILISIALDCRDPQAYWRLMTERSWVQTPTMETIFQAPFIWIKAWNKNWGKL